MDRDEWDSIKQLFLKAIDLEIPDRAELIRAIDNSEVRQHVERLLAAHESANDFIVDPIAIERGYVIEENDQLVGSSIDEYQILSLIGSGGMGSVYLAEHRGENFSQRVAIKVIKGGLNTDALLKRFLMERQILARLEHPHIARMLDGGSTSGGTPYLVMEYVDGEPIREYCNSKGLGVRERLRLFQKVCSGLSYAHQNLVVHRDLKPSNILVTKEDEPKLLDFGIAKLLSPDWAESTEEATITQLRILTPEYASPEHIRGETTSTSSDIYSLGIILYELLTGKRPFEFSGLTPNRILEKLLTAEPVKPSRACETGRNTLPQSDVTKNESISWNDSRVASELRGDLDNIILKAIQPEIELRYSSVFELSEDIRRYLSGLPVKATANSTGYRLKKFIKRNRAMAIGSTLAAASLIVGTGLSLWQYSVANEERRKAESRFHEVRGLANTIIFDHYERIKSLPGATEARAKLISDALGYLDKLSEESSGDIQLQRELVAAYKRLAEVQGSVDEAGNLGENDASMTNYLKALSLQESIVSDALSTIDDRRTYGNLLLDVSLLLDRENDVSQQNELINRGFSIFEDLLNENPDRRQARADMARALWFKATFIRGKGDNDGAIELFNRTIQIYDELLAEYPGEPKYRRNQALTWKNLGSVYFLQSNFAAALESYKKALVADAELAAAAENDVSAQMDLSFSHISIARAYFKLNDPSKAFEEFSKGVKIQERLHNQDPKNMFVLTRLIRSYASLAESLRDLNRLSEAEWFYQKSFQLLSTSPVESLSQIERAQVALMYFSRANFFLRRSESMAAGRKQADQNSAIADLEKAHSIFSELKVRQTLDPAFEKDMAAVSEKLLQVHARSSH